MPIFSRKIARRQDRTYKDNNRRIMIPVPVKLFGDIRLDQRLNLCFPFSFRIIKACILTPSHAIPVGDTVDWASDHRTRHPGRLTIIFDFVWGVGCILRGDLRFGSIVIIDSDSWDGGRASRIDLQLWEMNLVSIVVWSDRSWGHTLSASW